MYSATNIHPSSQCDKPSAMRTLTKKMETNKQIVSKFFKETAGCSAASSLVAVTCCAHLEEQSQILTDDPANNDEQGNDANGDLNG